MITGIKLQGGRFEQPTTLIFFSGAADRYSVVFGRNGSGKSTIGRAFAGQRPAGSERDAQELILELIDAQILTDEENRAAGADAAPQVHVFNEEFIEDNVRLERQGLGTISLFGKQGDFHDQITALGEEISDLKQQAKASREAREAAAVRESREFASLKEKLSAGWAGRDSRIKGNKVNTAVPREVERLRAIDTHSVSTLDLLQHFNEKELEFDAVKSGSAIAALVPEFSATEFLAGFQTNLLSRALVAPSGSGIAGLVADSLLRSEQHVHEARIEFSNPAIDRCPFCLQSISSAYRDELMEAITLAVDAEAEEFAAQLEKAKAELIEFDVDPQLYQLDEVLSEKIYRSVQSLNQEIGSWNRALDAKKSNLYSSARWVASELDEFAGQLEETLRELKALRVARNAAFGRQREMKEQLLALNDKVGRAECGQEFDAHAEADRECGALDVKLDGTESRIASLESQRDNLRAEFSNVRVAVDQINASLALIFADHSRLRLKPISAAAPNDGVRYEVLARGKTVSPARLSVGERNVLALCYFFARFQEQVEKEQPQHEKLVVLDDPISSIDVENRVGIHIYLERRFAEILTRDIDTRILVMTHDLTTARSFEADGDSLLRALEDIPERMRPKGNKGWRRRSFVLGSESEGELLTCSLVEPKVENGKNGFGQLLNEYRVLLEQVYHFAAQAPFGGDQQRGEESMVVGNAMRRILEAFGTFIYNERIISSSRLQDAYEQKNSVDLNFALGSEFRYILHGASHAAEATASLSVFGGGVTFHAEQLRSTARKLLALMYGLQPEHIAAYLPGDRVESIKGWEAESLRVLPPERSAPLRGSRSSSEAGH